jgi:hypothetical protein
MLISNRVKKYGLTMMGMHALHSHSCPSTNASSDCRRSGQGLHQEDHVSTKGVDVRWQDLEARGRNYQQRDRRARRALAVRRKTGSPHSRAIVDVMPRSKYSARTRKPRHRRKRPTTRTLPQSRSASSTVVFCMLILHQGETTHQKRKPKPKFKLKSSPSSDRSQLQSLSSLC